MRMKKLEIYFVWRGMKFPLRINCDSADVIFCGFFISATVGGKKTTLLHVLASSCFAYRKILTRTF